VTQSKSAKLTRGNKHLIEAAGRHSGDYLLAIASMWSNNNNKNNNINKQLLDAVVVLIE